MSSIWSSVLETINMSKSILVAAVMLATALPGSAWAARPATAEQAAAVKLRSCSSIANAYPGTRYAGVALSRITARGVTCTTARRVARGAHRKALGIAQPPDGIRRFSWDGWTVTGDLRPSSDIYVATKNGRRVRWRF